MRGTPPDWLTSLEHSRDDAVLHGEKGSRLPGVPRRCFRAVEAHSSGINDVVFERDGVLLVTAGDDSFVKVWEPMAGVMKAALKVMKASKPCSDCTYHNVVTPEYYEITFPREPLPRPPLF